MTSAIVTRLRDRRDRDREISILDVERRVLRACKTCRALPDADRKFHILRSPWPEFAQSIEEAYGYTEATLPRFRPTPFDVSDMLTALGWVRGLERRDFKLVWWRSFDVSFGQIAKRIGRSDETARRRFKDAIIYAWGRANGFAQAFRPSA